MKRKTWFLLVALIAAQSLAAQSRKNNCFTVLNQATGLSAADATVTVQQPTSGSKWVSFEYAQVYCSVACQVTLSRDGTAASTTAATEVSLNGGVTPTAETFTSSNVGAGTTITAYELAAGAEISIDLDGLFLEDNDTNTNNLTIDTDDITGDASITVKWCEE